MKIQRLSFKVQTYTKRKYWFTIPGGFSKREDAVRYGNKFYKEGEALDMAGPRVGQFRVLERVLDAV